MIKIFRNLPLHHLILLKLMRVNDYSNNTIKNVDHVAKNYA